MSDDFMANVEITLDEFRSRIAALELAVTQIPQINFEADVSRPAGVVVEPAALVVP